jgi:hypothetical protein
MRHETGFPAIAPDELAALGAGRIAYLRELEPDEAAKLFPGMPPLAAGSKVWALFGADGAPLALAENAGAAFAAALENQLAPVAVH